MFNSFIYNFFLDGDCTSGFQYKTKMTSILGLVFVCLFVNIIKYEFTFIIYLLFAVVKWYYVNIGIISTIANLNYMLSSAFDTGKVTLVPCSLTQHVSLSVCFTL